MTCCTPKNKFVTQSFAPDVGVQGSPHRFLFDQGPGSLAIGLGERVNSGSAERTIPLCIATS